MADFILVEKLGMRFTLDGRIYAVQFIEKDHDVPLRINKAQKNSISLQKMGISE